MKTTFITFLAALLLLTACHWDGSGKYVGKWINVKNANESLVIERNGDNFMLRITAPSLFGGQRETHNIPATFKEGALQLQAHGGGTVAMVLDDKTGHLTSGQAEYRKTD